MSFRTITIAVVMLLCLQIIEAQELRRSGFMGVAAGALNDEARKQLPANENGILVQSVVEGGSAKGAGIQANDIITKVNEHQVIDVTDFVQTVKGLRAGDMATISIWRNGGALAKQLLVKP